MAGGITGQVIYESYPDSAHSGRWYRWDALPVSEQQFYKANRNSEGKHLLGKQEADGKSILSES
jgi:hypothetical protein